MYKRFFILLLTLTLTVIVSACNGSSKESDTQNSATGEEASQSNSNSNNESNTNNEEQSNIESDDNQNNEKTYAVSNEDEADAGSTDKNLPEPIEINEEVRKDGVTFTLEKITFEADYIAVSFHANNTTGHAVKLAAEGRAKDGNLGGITLIDDTGYEYRYIAKVDSHRIQIFDGEEVTGTVSFAGKIQDDAKSLDLAFNPNESSDRKPEFRFEGIDIKR